MARVEGSTAPDFSLPSADFDRPVQLSDYRGEKVVLLFFPLAFTGGCTREMCSVSDDLEAYRKLDARVLGISVDAPPSQSAWKREEGIEIPLLSDFRREVIERYDVTSDDPEGLGKLARRSAFVIDREGTIRYSWETTDPSVLPDFNEIKSVLEECS